MRSQSVIFFDLTQLVLRVVFPTPTGIGRVELAYARYLLEQYPDQVQFLFALPRRVQVIPIRVAARYINALSSVWHNEDQVSDKVIQKLQAFLKGDERFLTYREKPGHYVKSRVTQRISLVADLLMGVALEFIRPRNLSKYSDSDVPHAYVSVSNSIFSSNWIVRWLEKSPSVAGIFLLHDIIPITNPEFTLPKTTIRHHRYIRRLAETAQTIIANSTYTLDCLKQYAAGMNMALPNLVTAPLGVDESFIHWAAPRQKCAPYFVFIATIEPRKNHLMLLQVWQRLVDKFGADTPKLVLVGRRGWENENTLDMIERAETLRDHVIECSNVPDQLVIKLLSNACAALFPSHVEGFGLPLAEALALRTPVICSDIPPFKEIAGDVPEYVDPLAGRGWLRVVMEYAAKDSPKRAQQMARMKGFKPHTWDDHLLTLDSILLKAGVTGPDFERALGQEGAAASAGERAPAAPMPARQLVKSAG